MSSQAITRITDTIANRARTAASGLMDIPHRQVNTALIALADLLTAEEASLRRENDKDLKAARRKGLSAAMIDRLRLSPGTISSMVDGLRQLTRLACPVGAITDRRVRPNGLVIYKTRTPIGVVAIIYESRPNVTVDAAAICLKSHNAVILRGGSEAFHSNMKLARLFEKALRDSGLPRFGIQIVPTTDRAAVSALLRKTEHIDLVIPRGGEGLIRLVVGQSLIPVIKHYKGVCHVYISGNADMKIAVPIVVNAKVQRPGVCNAMETLLLDKALSDARKRIFMDALAREGVSLRVDGTLRRLYPRLQKATPADWNAEYLDLRLAVKCVDGLDEAVRHINQYGSHHTDAIVTRSKSEAAAFVRAVDSASVMVNTSTRFSDGGEYGMGCEIGISTDKLHARGPMGIDELTTYKWVVEGNGQLRG